MITQTSLPPTDIVDAAPARPTADFAGFTKQLQQELSEQEALIAELKPRAAPHLDVVAWSTSQASMRVVVQINAALARISAGTFGTCTSCHRQIKKARLEVIPYAARCVPCQS